MIDGDGERMHAYLEDGHRERVDIRVCGDQRIAVEHLWGEPAEGVDALDFCHRLSRDVFERLFADVSETRSTFLNLNFVGCRTLESPKSPRRGSPLLLIMMFD